MSVERVITEMQVTWWKTGNEFVVQVRSTFCESTIGGGKIRKESEWYEHLTLEEARDVVEAVSSGSAPGDSYGVQMSMFELA